MWTTFKARTFVQPQFQKAVLSEHLAEEADRGPKDHILAYQGAYWVGASRDTTGELEFLDAPLPSGIFPSDHALVYAQLTL